MIQNILDAMGISHHSHLDEIIYVTIVIIVAVGISQAIRWLFIWLIRKILTVRKSTLAQDMLKISLVTKSTHIIPPLVLMSMLPFAFTDEPVLHTIIIRLLWCYFVIAFGIGLNAFITLSWIKFDQAENTKRHPLRGLLGTAHGIVWIIVVIIVVSIIINKSPGYLLTGMAALSAAIMLIFKDSILGFVSGIQLSTNDMLRVGDWINVPSVSANGTVEDVSLTVVKVRAWDNTIIMLPPYTLVSTSFTNYRGMYEAGYRRIDQNFLIDMASVKPLDDANINQIVSQLPTLKPFIDQQIQLRSSGNKQVFNGGTAPVNGTIDTNLGLFRAYLCNYLLQHEYITDKQNIIVRLQSPTGQGVPLNIYCFTEGDAIYWVKYEAIQSEIMEHVLSVAPIFSLEIYNALSRNKIEVTKPSSQSN